MWSMFYEANSFNQDLSTWDVSSVITMVNMFMSRTFPTNYSNTLIGWAGQNVQMELEPWGILGTIRQPTCRKNWLMSTVGL